MGMSMSRKHFNAIAEALRVIKEAQHAEDAKVLIADSLAIIADEVGDYIYSIRLPRTR